LEYANVE